MEDKVWPRVDVAIGRGDTEVVRDLLTRHPELIKERGNKFLKIAARSGKFEIVSLLAEMGADIHCKEIALPRLYAAVRSGDMEVVRDITSRYPDTVKKQEDLNDHLRDAAMSNQVAVMAFLVELGADIHAPDGSAPEGVIRTAAGFGAIDAVRWLLDRGAKINYEVDGVTRCFALTGAVHGGHLDVVKLLVEHGAAINALWANFTPLSYALMYGHKEIEEYLRSQGALEPWQVKGHKAPGLVDDVLEHVGKHFFNREPLSLREVVPGDPPIALHFAQRAEEPNYLALVTSGMSAKPMTVPAGGEEYQYAELVMYLPAYWEEENLRDPENAWMLEWMLRVAHYPHENKTWLGGASAVIANGEPPQPLGPGVPFTCVLVLADPKIGRATLTDGRSVVFYMLFPLYTEERDFEKEHGTKKLIEQLHEFWDSIFVTVERPNVVEESQGSQGPMLSDWVYLPSEIKPEVEAKPTEKPKRKKKKKGKGE